MGLGRLGCAAIAAGLVFAGGAGAANPGYANARKNAIDAQNLAWHDAESQQLGIRVIVEACPAFKKAYAATPQSGKARALAGWKASMADTKERLQQKVIPTLLDAAKADGNLRTFTKTLTPPKRRPPLVAALAQLSAGDRDILSGLNHYEAAIHEAEGLDCTATKDEYLVGKKRIADGKADVLRGIDALEAV